MDRDMLRAELDAVDASFLQLFIRRMALVSEWSAAIPAGETALAVRRRERALSDRVANVDGSQASAARFLYRTLFDLERTQAAQTADAESPLLSLLQKAVQEAPAVFPRGGRIALQGTEGSYSQEVTDRLFPHGQLTFCASFEDVFEAVQAGRADYGILPIENSNGGSVGEVYELLQQYRASIVAASRLYVQHALLARRGVSLHEVREVVSHPQALAQCAQYLRSLSEVTLSPAKNTALAAQAVASSERSDVAAIASLHCADLYGLDVLDEHIQNSANNYTRFICITKDMRVFPGANKISIMLSTPHRPGGLYHVMAHFATLGLNLTKLESRPIPGRDFEFMFYFDFEGSVLESDVQQLLATLERTCKDFVFLGNYIE